MLSSTKMRMSLNNVNNEVFPHELFNLRHVPTNTVATSVTVDVVEGEGHAAVTVERIVDVSCRRRRPSTFSKLSGTACTEGSTEHASKAMDKRRPSMNFMSEGTWEGSGWGDRKRKRA